MGGAAARARLVEVLEPAVTGAGFDLEDVSVRRAGSRSLLRVVVDRDGGVDLDAVAEASRAVEAALDADDDVMPGPYVLEMTSPGVDRPLTAPRHWRRALGRLVRVVPEQGPALTGRLVAADEQGAVLATGDARGGSAGRAGRARNDGSDGSDAGDARDTVRIEYAAVRRAVVQVEFTGGAEDEDGP